MFQVNFDLPVFECSTPRCKPRVLIESLFTNGQFETKVGSNTRSCRRLMKVRVYRNLNKPEFYSIMAMEGPDKGKVVGYAKSVLIENVNFRVSEASRQRVLRDKRRNVHAFCEGVVVDAANVVQPLQGDIRVVTYNPYKGGSFYCKADGQPQQDGCTQALLQGSNVHILESA